jgi:hypothetical protein
LARRIGYGFTRKCARQIQDDQHYNREGLNSVTQPASRSTADFGKHVDASYQTAPLTDYHNSLQISSMKPRNLLAKGQSGTMAVIAS